MKKSADVGNTGPPLRLQPQENCEELVTEGRGKCELGVSLGAARTVGELSQRGSKSARRLRTAQRTSARWRIASCTVARHRPGESFYLGVSQDSLDLALSPPLPNAVTT